MAGHNTAKQKVYLVNTDYPRSLVINNDDPFAIVLNPGSLLPHAGPVRQQAEKPNMALQSAEHFVAINNLPLVLQEFHSAIMIQPKSNPAPAAPYQNRNAFWLFLLFFVAGVLFFELSLLLFPWTFIARLVSYIGFFNILISSEFLLLSMHDLGMVRARFFWYLFLAIAILAALFFTLGAYALVSAAIAMLFTTMGILAVCLGVISLLYAFSCKFDKNDSWFN